MTEPSRMDRQSFTIHELMDLLGWQAGEVAHELNNLLTAVYGYAELGVLDANAGDDAHKYFQEILKMVARSTDLVHELLAQSRRRSLQSEAVNLSDVVHDMEKILRYICGEDIELVILATPELCNTNIIPGQVQQVLLNLALNARDAMQNVGRLVLQTENVTFDENSDERPVELDPGEYVMLMVCDSGIGIDEDMKHQIFEPYFTTKGTGTGLGLATCNRIVTQSGGHITFDSQLGLGTVFKIYFPRLG